MASHNKRLGVMIGLVICKRLSSVIIEKKFLKLCNNLKKPMLMNHDREMLQNIADILYNPKMRKGSLKQCKECWKILKLRKEENLGLINWLYNPMSKLS